MQDLAFLLFYLQQFGVALGLGASTIALIFYFASSADGIIESSERRFVHAAEAVLRIALFLIIVTGFTITIAHILAEETATVSLPSFVFKWVLIGVIITCGRLVAWKMISRSVGGALGGATWYALFTLHTIAPIIGWEVLLPLYVAWVLFFSLMFWVARRSIARWYMEGDAKEWVPPHPSPREPQPQAVYEPQLTQRATTPLPPIDFVLQPKASVPPQSASPTTTP